MNDDLITEIEQFLAEGGEPAEPTPHEQMMEVCKAFGEAIGAAISCGLAPRPIARQVGDVVGAKPSSNMDSKTMACAVVA